MNKIITIGREFGSGGRELGRRLAEELGFQYYDREILTEIARHTSMSEDYIRQVVERTPNHLFPITVGQSFSYINDYSLQQMQTIYQAHSDIIRALADKSDCVIVGRCADYILEDRKPLRVFVYAGMDSRVRRCARRSTAPQPPTEKELRRIIREIDRNRARYYEYYTDRRWGDKLNYDLCVNTTDVVIRDIVPHLAKML